MCAQWESTKITRNCGNLGRRELLSANGDDEGLTRCRWRLLRDECCCNLVFSADVKELGHKSAFVCQNTVICVELRMPRWLKRRCSLRQVHSISIALLVRFIPRGELFLSLSLSLSPTLERPLCSNLIFHFTLRCVFSRSACVCFFKAHLCVEYHVKYVS